MNSMETPISHSCQFKHSFHNKCSFLILHVSVALATLEAPLEVYLALSAKYQGVHKSARLAV